jgi:hypothetical protein
MVYLVVLRGQAANVTAARNQLIRTSNGWLALAGGVLLVVQERAGVEALRNFLGRQPGIEAAVLSVENHWATSGCDDIMGWLRDADGMF